MVIEPTTLNPCLRAYIALSAWRRRSSGDRVPSSSTTPTLAETVFGAMIGHGSARTAQIRSTSRLASVGVPRRPHEDDELVAAEPGDHVVGAHDLPEPRRHLDQHLVADVVTEAVVDVLEVVEIDEGDDRRFVRGARTFERVGERGPVRQLRQRVGRHFADEPPLALAHLLLDRRRVPRRIPLTTHSTPASRASATPAIMCDPPRPTIVGATPVRHGDLAADDADDAPREDDAPVDAPELGQELHREECVRDAEQRAPTARVQDDRRRARGRDDDADLFPYAGARVGAGTKRHS